MDKSLKQKVLEMKISDDDKIALYLKMCGGRPYIPSPRPDNDLRLERIIRLVDISAPECRARLEEYRRSRIRS